MDKKAWASVVFEKCPSNPEKIPESFLREVTGQLLFQHHRIIMESVSIIKSTKYADTRKGRIDLCRFHYKEMQKLKPFCDCNQKQMVAEAERAMRGI